MLTCVKQDKDKKLEGMRSKAMGKRNGNFCNGIFKTTLTN
jgi:hypothetical protein